MKPYQPKENLELYNWKKKITTLIDKIKSSKKDITLRESERILKEVLNEKDNIKTFALKWMERAAWFKSLPNSVPMSGLLEAIKNNDGQSAKIIVRETQKKSPLHPELPLFKLNNGESLIALAARTDKDKVISELTKMNPLWAMHKDDEGNTPLHIASKHICINTLISLGKKHPNLLNMRNKKGLKPIDLEAGPILLKRISKNDIKVSIKKAKATEKAAKRILSLQSKPTSTKSSYGTAQELTRKPIEKKLTKTKPAVKQL
jgi:hypothetical protein